MKGFRVISVYIVITFYCFTSKAQTNEPKNDLPFLISSALNLYLSKPDSAIALSSNALAIALAEKNLYFEGYSYYVLTKAYWVKANYRLSTEYGFKALKIFETSSHKRELVYSLVAVGRTLIELGNYGKARALIKKARKLSLEDSDPRTLAETHREYSYLLTETDQLDSALLYADKGLAIYEKSGDSLDASILYGRKSRVYFRKKDFQKSREYAFRAMLIDTLVGNMRGLGISYFLAAQNEHALKNLSGAKSLAQRSIHINRKIGNLAWLARGHELLATVYLDFKKAELAATELQRASFYKDSLYNLEKSGQAQEMQLLYELEGKENTIKLLEQENALRQQQVKNQQLFVASLLIGILLLVLILFFVTRLRKIQTKINRDLAAKNAAFKKQKEEMQAQARELQQLNNLQTKLFSVISHDLRGPISNLQLLLDLFTQNLMTAEEMLMVSNKLKINLNITQRTLENLLNWSLSQMDGIKTEKKRIGVKACIDEACRLMEEVAHRKSISIVWEVNDSVMAWADPDQVQLVLRNLIHNGIKFSKIGDQLVIEASKDNGYCRIKIKDSGIGMTQEEIDTIVGSKEHFTKVGTEQEKGTGLGLLLCKEFVERNGGALSIESKLDEGTEISFTLLSAN